MKTIKVVAAVIRSEDDAGRPVVFATQRGYGDYKDWWEFPGGKVEPGEAPEAALVREIREELDAGIEVERFLTTVEYDYPEFHLSMDCFWCRISDGHPRLLEHEAARWLPLDDLRQVGWLPADVLAVEAVEKEVRGGADPTLAYYEQNADSFVEGTISADMSDARSRFLRLLPAGARILDFGCGSGRDSKVFLENGYGVDAVDGSEELCRRAAEYTGLPVKCMRFQELSASDRYDGIWACASILHLSHEELADVLRRVAAALKDGGILYMSFKYGEHEGMRGGRYFSDFTEETLAEFMKQVPSLRIREAWVTSDVRPGRGDERWINVLAESGGRFR